MRKESQYERSFCLKIVNSVGNHFIFRDCCVSLDIAFSMYQKAIHKNNVIIIIKIIFLRNFGMLLVIFEVSPKFLDDFGYDWVYGESCHSKFKSLLPLNEIQGWQGYRNDCDEIEQRAVQIFFYIKCTETYYGS